MSYANVARCVKVYLAKAEDKPGAVRGSIITIESDGARSVKNPSFWIKTVQFAHKYEKHGSFWLAASDKDAKEYLDSYSVLLAGDLNLDLRRSYSSAAVLEREGFHSADCPALCSHHHAARHSPSPAHDRLGVSCGASRVYLSDVCDEVTAPDHDPISLELKFTAV